jgi:RHH-type rel operon transcriptional repressor/antitoxin RelB
MAAHSFSLPEDIAERLQVIAQSTGRSPSDFMLNAIIDHIEDAEDIALADERLIEIRAGRSKTYSLEEVERELGLAD